MFSQSWFRWGAGGVVVACILAAAVYSQSPAPEQVRQTAQAQMQKGNWREAYDGFRQVLLNPDAPAAGLPNDLNNAANCLQRLGRISEMDDLLEMAVETHPKNWRVLRNAARLYVNTQHQGFMIAGEYHRGPHRGGGKMVNSLERDRVRALQLYQQALPLARDDDNKSEVAELYLELSNALLYNRGHYEAWRLQYLTSLDELPDYDDGYPYYRGWNGAPVDEEGNPVFHHAPKTWETAETDGERWRHALEMAMEMDASRMNSVRLQLAQFHFNQFGAQTMQNGGYGRFFGMPVTDDGDQDESGTYALHTLKEGETIAKLATGVKRFELPDEFNFIKIYQNIAAEPKTGHAETALNALANVFANRRQYAKSAEYWKQSKQQYGDRNDYKQQRIDQIEGNWGRFETVSVQPSGVAATVEFRFRNAKELKLKAERINVERLLADVKNYLKTAPGRIDWKQVNIGNIGHRIIHQNEAKYLEQEVAAWDLELKPRENHWDRRITVETPLRKPGAYMVTGALPNGNVSKVVLWVADTAIVKKPLSNKQLYYVADAVSGKPVGNLQLDFFGWRQNHLGNNRWQVLTAEFSEKSSGDGLVTPDPRDLQTNYQWLITAKGADGRFAYLGFTNAWAGRYYDAEYEQTKVYAITDRPVYRPEQKVNFKFWVRHAQYDKEDVSQFAGKTFPVEVFNPKNEKIFDKTLQLDEYGGVNADLELPEDAALGVYRINVQAREANRWFAQGGTTFRVEEYKKPEYEVTVEAPTEPVMLGEEITAKIKAKYYFGSPVTNATVKYKVMRETHSDNWYPYAPWDWFYGEGYWWFAYDCGWYPGWSEWRGCMRPIPWWWHGGRHAPPELVAEVEAPIGPDGMVDVKIDTAIAKEMHGDQDHKYTITAEVRDQSRRTIVGTGEVLVARKPFKVFSWTDRGYYRVGDVITANFQAHTLDRQPVDGEGVLTLYRVTYDEKNQPVENPVRRWDLPTGVEGRSKIQIKASAPGQYRLAYEVTDSQQHTIEGGYLFTIMGEGFDGSDYRFNELELIPDQKQYGPGDTVKLQVNTNRPGATVLLFVRPANGVYLEPKVLHLDGKSTVEEFGVIKKDMPNFFVEAVTVYNGRAFQETKEIVVPPEKRVIDVAVTPSKSEYKPGEKAKVEVQLTEQNGEPFQGSTVVSIYDKSVEYISGGSNTPDIREFFWKWRRHHNPNQETNLARYFGNMTLPNQRGMEFIGAFGATLADEADAFENEEKLAVENAARVVQTRDRNMRGGGLGGGGFGAPGALAPQAEMAMDAAAAPAQGGRQAFANAAPMLAQRKSAGPTSSAAAGGDLVEATVRKNFADTALWVGNLETDAEGKAEVELDMPENLTAWKIKVWAMGHGTKVGSGEKEVVTRKNLIVRLQAPRFFVQKDEVVLSANVHNYLDAAKQAQVSLELEGGTLKIDGESTQTVEIPADGETRVDWRVHVVEEGQAIVRMKALTDEESDAMEMTFPVFVHGMLKQEAWAGTVRRDQDQAAVTVTVPAERRPEQSVLEVRYSPTLATAMVDALPYLADYPYGCTEQTLNRFLPSVVTRKTLQDMGVNLAEIQAKRTNLNAQEIGDAAERAKRWKRFDRNPVFDEDELDRIVREGVTRLESMQVSDGGWGWFSGWGERSYPHTTAVVVHGLQVAKSSDVQLPPNMLERGVAWLKNYQAQQVQWIKNFGTGVRPAKQRADELDAFCYMVLADAGQFNDEMREFLFRDRKDLAVYAKAAFGLGLVKQEDQKDKLDVIMENIDQFLVQDEENETAYLKLPQNTYWWYWYGSEIEANAFYLKLLSAVEPKGQRAPRLVKYLLNNRKHATYWNSTRDTAYCVEAFADYIRGSGEDEPNMTVEVWLDGKKRKEVKITRENLFTYEGTFRLVADEVTTGSHTVEIRRAGEGNVYFNAYLTNFTLEDDIKAAGLEIKVQRKYYKLKPVKKEIKVSGSRGQALDQRVEKYERVELKNLDEVVSGDLVEIELEIDSKNDYEYIVFEDMKPAGFEPVDVRSGYSNEGLRSYMELRDEKVAFFVRWLARGKHSIAYRMRAEIPGRFAALPTRAEAMYAPELKANSDEIKLKVLDQPEAVVEQPAQ